ATSTSATARPSIASRRPPPTTQPRPATGPSGASRPAAARARASVVDMPAVDPAPDVAGHLVVDGAPDLRQLLGAHPLPALRPDQHDLAADALTGLGPEVDRELVHRDRAHHRH